MRPLTALAVVLASPLGSGCTTSVCDTGIMPGVIVEIRDAQTSTAIADSVTGSVIDGSYSDSLRPYTYDSTGLLLARGAADERVGTYTVLLTRPSYATWSTSGVRVRAGDCGVQPVVLRARMTRNP